MVQKVIILGAGITGLSLAWKLSGQGVGVSVFESNDSVGGLSRTLWEDGYSMDIGPHWFYSNDAQIRETVLGLFDHKLNSTSRHVKLYYKGKFIEYPFTAYGAFVQMGVLSGLRSGFSFLKRRIAFSRSNPLEDGKETLEDWAVQNFGEHLYHTFFKPYTEQFWKMPCAELSSDVIPPHTRRNFINKFHKSLYRHLDKIDSSNIEREVLRTYYPDSGFGEIAEKIAHEAMKAGACIYTKSTVIGVDELSDKRVRVRYEYNGGQKESEGDYVVSTIPPGQFVKMLNPPPPNGVLSSANKLDTLCLSVLGMVTRKQNILKHSAVYCLGGLYNRISEMNEFSPATSPKGENILVVEMPCLKDSAIWKASKEELFDRCIGSLTKMGFLERRDVRRLLLIRAQNAYSFYNKGYDANLKHIVEHIKGRKNMAILGRTGEFVYMDVDMCIRKAFDFASHLIGKLSMTRQTGPKGMKTPNHDIRLNIGCGGCLLPEYINIDRDSLETLNRRYPQAQFPKDIEVHDYDIFNLPFADGTVAEVKADSLIEHLSFIEEPRFFYEVRRVLRPGGIFQFSTTDFEQIAKLWLSAKDDWKDFYRNDKEAILKQHWFGQYSYSLESRWGYLCASIFGSQNGDGQFHRNCYTVSKIRTILKRIGFQELEISHYFWKGNRDPMIYVKAAKT